VDPSLLSLSLRCTECACACELEGALTQTKPLAARCLLTHVYASLILAGAPCLASTGLCSTSVEYTASQQIRPIHWPRRRLWIQYLDAACSTDLRLASEKQQFSVAAAAKEGHKFGPVSSAIFYSQYGHCSMSDLGCAFYSVLCLKDAPLSHPTQRRDFLIS
jgi:hypothetical protein